ncbi:quinolinate phoshoribosyltransferase [Arabidopsis thaliana]|uniref:nicotinate-nucleotide diphosphorylase (carboxylating) n=1 Tax=Arabidopsis thaliana TaxID=3702 RepID=A8MRX1_ARATH|nr:quinolinate phoshoribosyltransferase [Arabidopsis thaliana]AEC05441.1 quinolinate phoshoribosyltransferase [Arabidopsis thaliana]|eukprot:NP_001077864.1 quinolinate phoshoribosyltransferase [Arabidopsis thaliana]
MISVSRFLSPQFYAIPRSFVKMSASATQTAGEVSMGIKPPSHPTYDLKAVIKLALAEDAGHTGDVTCMATIPFDMEVEAYFLAKEDGIVAGVALADMIFEHVDPSLKDGDYVHKGLKFGKVSGNAHKIVVAERVLLNFMQRMSGIATLTKLMADAASPACILETRKTAPGLRLVDKWAVLIGGGRNHRMGLFDMVMIKDNHISAAGGIVNAVKSVDEYLKQKNLEMDVEVETRTLEEVKEVLEYASGSETRLTRIMLDNMVVPLENGDVDVTMLKDAVELINGRFETEASGNVTLETVHKIGQSGVTFISSGALTHSVKALDISLKIDTELALEVGRRTKRA